VLRLRQGNIAYTLLPAGVLLSVFALLSLNQKGFFEQELMF
jgi:hypothetical protein